MNPALGPELIETLRQAQRFGFFGARPIDEAAEHSLAFVGALDPVQPGTRLIDLGSGGGLPGLVLASALPQTDITLLDRRQKRTDFLQLAVTRLGFDHVHVLCADAEQLAAEVERGARPAFDVVTARGFGPPSVTLRLARRMLSEAGRIVISEPPDVDRWDRSLLDQLGLTSTRCGAVRLFRLRP